MRPPICTYAPRGPPVRADGLTKSRKTPPLLTLPLFDMTRYAHKLIIETGAPTGPGGDALTALVHHIARNP